MKAGDEEVVDRGNAGGLQQKLGLRSTLLAGYQHLGDGRGLGEGKLAMLLSHEVAAQRDEKENAQAAAGETDEDGLHRMRVEMKDVKCGQGEDRSGNHAAGSATDAGGDHVLQNGGTALVDASQADGQDGNRNRRFHSLSNL